MIGPRTEICDQDNGTSKRVLDRVVKAHGDEKHTHYKEDIMISKYKMIREAMRYLLLARNAQSAN